MNNKDVIDVLTSEIEWSENHLSDENRQVGEAFIKGLKQAIFLIKKYDEYNDPNNISVDSEYVTELENKAKMFDELVNILSYSATIKSCFPSVVSILERAKKLQEVGK